MDGLRFVKGAVAKKDIVPVLTHFSIANGRITGSNGVITMSAPVDLEFTAQPNAKDLVAALAAAEGTTGEAYKLTKVNDGKLLLQAGGLRVRIKCSEDVFPDVMPSGDAYETPALLSSFRLVAPYIAVDASRDWACGILVNQGTSNATNNIVLVQHWHGLTHIPTINVPTVAVRELLRLKEEATHVQVGDGNATFHFEGERWLRTQLYPTDWPNVDKVLQAPHDVGTEQVPPELLVALDKISSFLTERTVHFLYDENNKTAVLGDAPSLPACEATVDVPPVPPGLAYDASQLSLALGIAKTIAWQSSPSMFFGDSLRGCVLGQRVNGTV